MPFDTHKPLGRIFFEKLSLIKFIKWHWYQHMFLVAILGFGFFISAATYSVYNSCHKEFERQASVNAKVIEMTLKDILNETAIITSYISTQISQTDSNDLESINTILSTTSDIVSESKSVYSWTLFDWVSPDGNHLINSKMGIYKIPIIYLRDILELSRLYPNTLQISSPSIGNTSGIWVLPAGMGVTDQEGNYMGLLSLGVNIANLNTIIKNHLPDPNASFVVLNDDYRVVFQSANNEIDPKTSYYKDFLHDTTSFTQTEGRLKEDLKYKDISYTHYRKMKDQPFIILTGTETSILFSEFQSKVIARFLEIFIIGSIFLFLLYLSRRSLLKNAEHSYAIRSHFSHRLNLEMQGFMGSILGVCDILLRYYKGDLDVGISNEKKIKLISDIQQAALNLNSVTTNVLNLSHVNVNNLIRESVTMLSQLALMKKTKIRLSLQPCLTPLYADEVRFRQIIVTLLSLLLEYNPNSSCVCINTCCRSFKDKNYLVIKIRDNGFNLNIEDMRRISERFNVQSVDSTGLNLELSVAERLVSLHGGKFSFYNELEGKNKGKNFTLIFPFDPPEASLQKHDLAQLYDNVITFSGVQKK